MFSVRTLFLFIRGVDQTGRAFEPVDKRLRKLMATQLQMQRMAYRLMFAGAAFTAFAAMAGKALFGLMENASLGQLYLEDFNRVFNRLKQGLAEAIIDKFGPMLETWLNKLDDLSKDETWQQILAGIVVPAVIALGQIGPILLGAGVGLAILSAIAKALGALGMIKAASVVSGAAGLGIQIVLVAAVLFIVANIIWEFLPESWKEPIEKIRSETEKWALEVGLPVDVGGGPRLGRIEGLVGGPGLRGRGQGQSPWTQFNIQNFFQNVNTQADEEEIPDVVERSYRDAMRSRGIETG